MKSLHINDFSGGLVDANAFDVPLNCATELNGFDNSTGKLRVMHADSIIVDANKHLNNDTSDPFVNLGQYTTSGGDTILLGKRGTTCWFGINEIGVRKRTYGTEKSYISCFTDDFTTTSGAAGVQTPAGQVCRLGLATCTAATTAGNTWTLTDDPWAIALWIYVPSDAELTGNRTILTNKLWPSVYANSGLWIGLVDGKLSARIEEASRHCYVTCNTAFALDQWKFIGVYHTNTGGSAPVIRVNGATQTVTTDKTTFSGAWDLSNGEAVTLGGTPASNGRIVVDESLRCDISQFTAWQDADFNNIPSDSFVTLYNAEHDRYAWDSGLDYGWSWYPLLGTSYFSQDSPYAASAPYLRSRVNANDPERFVQLGNYLYMSPDEPASTDYLARWDGTYLISTSPVVTNGAAIDYTVLTIKECPVPSASSLRTGDTVYFAEWDVTSANYIWDVNHGCLLHDIGDSNITFYPPHPVTVNADHPAMCAIVRTHRAGIPEGTTTAANISAATTTLAAATYRYVWRYANSYTGYAGNVSAIATATVASSNDKKVTVSGWAAIAEQDINRVEIFRSTDGGAYYLISTLTTYDPVAGTPATWDDTGASTGTTLLESDSSLRARPGALRHICHYNNRLYAGGTEALPHWLSMSSLGDCEYWPGTQWDASTVETASDLSGGSVQVGKDSTEPITTLLPDIGAFADTGENGSDLLLTTTDRAFRWFGYTRSDFQLLGAFHDGAVSQYGSMNDGGDIVWINKFGHAMAIGSGSSNPVCISKNIWPNGISKSVVEDCKVYSWNGWQLFLVSGTLWMRNKSTGAWTSRDADYNSLLVRPGIKSSSLLGAANSDNGYITGTAGMSVAFTSDCPVVRIFDDALEGSTSSGYCWNLLAPSFATGVLRFPNENLIDGYTIKGVTACFRASATPGRFYVTLELYDGIGSTSPLWYDEVQPYNQGINKPTYVKWEPEYSTSIANPRLRITMRSAAVAPDIAIEWLQVDYENNGPVTWSY